MSPFVGRFRPVLWLTTAAALALLAGPAYGAPGRWVATWGASPQAPSVRAFAAVAGFRDQTVRNIVFASIGGSEVRVRLSNAFGRRPLAIGRAAIGVAAGAARVGAPGSVPLSFGGRPSVVIAPGADVLSDPAPLRVQPLQQLAVSIFLPRSSGPATEHAQAEQVDYLASGDHALDSDGRAFSPHSRSWYFLDGVDVRGRRLSGAIVALGDSITDGVGSSLGSNARWPDDLARRLATVTGGRMGVADEGLGGNRLLTSLPGCGPSALRRIGRDVLERPGARAVILLEGINDIGMGRSPDPLTTPRPDVSAGQIIAGYEQIIERVHAAGLKIFGGTLLPFARSLLWSPAGEAKRQAVNRWIRTAGAFDGVVDFAAAVADPADPLALTPAYDSGDHLHPNDAGYARMADAIDLSRLLADL